MREFTKAGFLAETKLVSGITYDHEGLGKSKLLVDAYNLADNLIEKSKLSKKLGSFIITFARKQA